MSVNDKSIKFPTHHYVGFQSRPSHDSVPLGFMTPEGTDAAAKKRKATVDNWAASGGYYGRNEATDKLPAQVFENKPLTGFKLGRNVSHGYGWGQGNVKWRIEDPRGFELEITSPNLAQLMGFCTLEQGEIQEQCIWARLGAENILVPVNSDVYANTVRNTERMSKKASLKDIGIGDTAILHNGDEGIYYGAFYIVSTTTDKDDTDSDHYGEYAYAGRVIAKSDKKRHVFLMQTPKEDGTSSKQFFKAISSPKLSELFEAEKKLTHVEAEIEVNRLISEGVQLSESTNDYGRSPKAVSINQLSSADFTRSVETTTLDDIVTEAVATGVTGYMLNYKVDEVAKGALFIIDGEQMYQVGIRDYLEKRNRCPGGSEHNPTYHTRPDQWSIALNRIDKKSFEDTGRLKYITRQGTRYYGGYRNEVVKNYIEVQNTPQTVTRYKMTAKTSAGTEVCYYL
jgi:hypothetical protein